MFRKVADLFRHPVARGRVFAVLVFGMGCFAVAATPAEEANSIAAFIGWGVFVLISGLLVSAAALPWPSTCVAAAGSVMVLGPSAAGLLGMFAGLVSGLAIYRRDRWIEAALFNTGRIGVATVSAGLVYAGLGGRVGVLDGGLDLGRVAVLCTACLLVESLIIASALTLSASDLSIWRAWRRLCLQTRSLVLIGLVALGAMAAVLYLRAGMTGLVMSAGSLVLAQLCFRHGTEIVHLRRCVREYEGLQVVIEFAKGLGPHRCIDELLRDIADVTLRAVHGDAAFIWLVRHGEGVTVVTSGLLSHQDVSRNPYAQAVRQAIKLRKTVSLQPSEDPVRAGCDGPGAGSGPGGIYVLPLFIRGEPVGALGVRAVKAESPGRSPFALGLPAGWTDEVAPEEDGQASIAILSGLASVAALAIDQILSQELIQCIDDPADMEWRQNSRTGSGDPTYEGLVGDSPAMRDLYAMIARVLGEDMPILLVGENGTGKELVARVIHAYSARRGGRFVAVDCGAISDSLAESELFGHRRGAFTDAREDRRGLLEEAEAGVVFLDQIESASLRLQTRLLRFLEGNEVRRVGESQSRAVDVRVIAATNEDLAVLVEKGRFRRDLFFRLNGLSLYIPPLRDRIGDIPLLVEHFLKREAARRGDEPCAVSAEAMRILDAYDWPGNVRELEHEIMRLAILVRPEKVIKGHHLSPRIRTAMIVGGKRAGLRSLHLRPAIERTERSYIREALRQSAGNKTRAAAMLGLTRQGLTNKMKRYTIPPKGQRPEGSISPE